MKRKSEPCAGGSRHPRLRGGRVAGAGQNWRALPAGGGGRPPATKPPSARGGGRVQQRAPPGCRSGGGGTTRIGGNHLSLIMIVPPGRRRPSRTRIAAATRCSAGSPQRPAKPSVMMALLLGPATHRVRVRVRNISSGLPPSHRTCLWPFAALGPLPPWALCRPGPFAALGPLPPWALCRPGPFAAQPRHGSAAQPAEASGQIVGPLTRSLAGCSTLATAVTHLQRQPLMERTAVTVAPLTSGPQHGRRAAEASPGCLLGLERARAIGT
jgi:hypothetical protein